MINGLIFVPLFVVGNLAWYDHIIQPTICNDSKVIEETVDYNEKLNIFNEDGTVSQEYIKNIDENLYYVSEENSYKR